MRESKVFSCLLDVLKPLTPFGLTVYNNKYSQSWELEAGCGWPSKICHTDVKAQILTLQAVQCFKKNRSGVILDTFMQRVYIDALLNALSSHAFPITINSLSLPSPSFADDISLLAIQLISREFKLRCKHNMQIFVHNEIYHKLAGITITINFSHKWLFCCSSNEIMNYPDLQSS